MILWSPLEQSQHWTQVSVITQTLDTAPTPGTHASGLQKKFYSFSFISNIRTESDLMMSGLPVNIFHELKSMQ